MTRLVRIDEEVARFAFEVHLREYGTDWFVAFTNPTAGPWKRIMAPDSDGVWGETHRFEREALRPDLVIVNDILRFVLILEAKDELAKLGNAGQVASSVEAATTIAGVLSTKGSNRYWGVRSTFNVGFGLLWGATPPAKEADVHAVFLTYADALASAVIVADTIVGIECSREASDGALICTGRTSSDLPIRIDLSAAQLLSALAFQSAPIPSGG